MRRPLQPSRTKSTPVNVAFHEAGHAVAACFLRRKLKAVAIEVPFRREDECTGYISYEPMFDPSQHAGPLDAKTREMLEQDVVISLAGPFAEEAAGGAERNLGYNGGFSTYLPEADAGTVCALAEMVAETFEERADFVGRMRKQTAKWMNQPLVLPVCRGAC